MKPLTIDSHQHFWQLGRFNYDWLNAPDKAPLRRDFLPADLKPLIDRAGVDRTIVVQTQHNIEENRWALQLAKENPFIAGVVGWVDLASPMCADQLQEFKHHPKFVGIRHITQDEPDENFIVRDDVLGGLKVLELERVPFDLLFYVQHLRHAATLAKQFPELPMVIDHLAKPHIKQGRTDDWREHFVAAAKYPNVFCKLSGMVTEADWKHWTPAQLKPYVHTALECFGPERLMYGSDWPVCTLAGSYDRVIGALRELLATLSPTEQALIFGGTAAKFYGC
jgi:L-fuconolactonase